MVTAFLIENFRAVLIAGVVLVVGLGQVNRVASSILGAVFFALIAFVASQVYAQDGGTVGVAGLPLPPPAFYGLCAVMIVLNLVSLRSALRRRAQRLRDPARS